MPGGILTVIFRSLSMRPVPLHFPHGRSMMLPSPLHVGQELTWTNVPKPLFLTFLILPVPLHLGHSRDDVPGVTPEPPQTSHRSVLGTSISLSAPFAASSS